MYFYIDPALITLGPISIRYYGLVYAIGFLIFYLLIRKKRHELGLTEEECSEILLTVGISMMIFGRLFHFLIDNPAFLFQNPLEFFMIWHGGIAFFGSFFGIIAGALGYLHFKKKPIKKTFFKLADLIVLVGSGVLIFGRLANFINQELVGTPTDVSWCFNFLLGTYTNGQPFFDTVCRHPYQLYAAFSHLILFIIIFYLTKKENKKKVKERQPGLIFGYAMITYSILRFSVDFWREDTRILLGLTSWQLISLVGVGIGIWFLTYLQKKREKHE